MRIFLTGQDGFIGSEILRQAREAGHEVMGLEKPFRMANPPWEEIAAFAPDICIHSAWIATPGEYTDSPLNALHRSWSVDLIKGLANSGISHFVVLGTCAEYAPSDSPLKEEAPLDPVSPYAREKRALHEDLTRMEKEMGFTYSWARIFYPYGFDEHPQRLISSLIRGWQSDNPMQLNNPESIRDYIHVRDVAAALLVIAEHRVAGAVNVGTGLGVRLGELSQLICKRTGISYTTSPSPTESNVMKDIVVADAGKLRSLGWEPRYDIESGIESFFVMDNQRPL